MNTDLEVITLREAKQTALEVHPTHPICPCILFWAPPSSPPQELLSCVYQAFFRGILFESVFTRSALHWVLLAMARCKTLKQVSFQQCLCVCSHLAAVVVVNCS